MPSRAKFNHPTIPAQGSNRSLRGSNPVQSLHHDTLHAFAHLNISVYFLVQEYLLRHVNNDLYAADQRTIPSQSCC